MDRPSEESTRTRAARFDFELFLRQLRSRKADPVLRYIKSFLKSFQARKFTTSEQQTVIADFQQFITQRMRDFEPFSLMDEGDYENARAGVEKLVMTKVYELTYSPAIPRAQLDESHREDVEFDEALEKNYEAFAHLTAKELDVDRVLVEHGDQFLTHAAGELNKMVQFKAPRAKIVCILNACKILFKLIESGEQHQNADEFLPLMVYTVLKGKVEHLYSNLKYVERFSFTKNSEVDYYLVSLTAAAEYVRKLGDEQKA
ncbi:CYFA0S29e00364g1_1 [Cyberlindnera fabianii]|uniref:CYFA0S29e00364g1_1 n=1 Tax=Cyberlindnera fabianii TaxID=36022 RepID=A0A061BCS2_CYBFA|nr:Vacuolar protein sorting-associated protein 9a [Cyberlindnera fabianii]CDR47126.1 CYFA0S29e00364g1_1 [Cyberlindnera fabianii]